MFALSLAATTRLVGSVPPATVLFVVCAILLLGATWIAVLERADRWARNGTRGDWPGQIVWSLIYLYSRSFHHVQVVGREHVPIERRGQFAPSADGHESDTRDPRGATGPLVIVCNHTAGIDPLLVQAAVQFEIRWIMMEEMNVGPVKWVTRFASIILVTQDGRDLGPTRDALRHLRKGGVIGIFPEGHIARPRGTILPFQAGVGYLIAKSRAVVIPAWISGTPEGGQAWDSLFRPSRSRIEFGPPIHFDATQSPAEIAATLEETLARMSGWARAES